MAARFCHSVFRFFTFTQVGFLVDRRAGAIKAKSFIEYVLFVTFFPHLIAGPILHHREIMPQFLKETTYRFNTRNFAVGLTIFTLGLAKKVVIADWFAQFVPYAFDHTLDVSRLEAWRCAFAYFLQLYFDFSGYSEMALGLARMFNVTFPANFDSPYKAPNIIEFWQRWNMSLTRYLTLYVYNPIALAITRARFAKGKPANAAALRTLDGFTAMVAFPTMITMTLIGIWHGSGLQFLAFGVLNGFYLCVAHAWRLLFNGKSRLQHYALARRGIAMVNVLLTCFCVMVAFIFFRAHSLDGAIRIFAAMTFWPTAAPAAQTSSSIITIVFHVKDVTMSDLIQVITGSHRRLNVSVGIALALFMIWAMPNILQIFADEAPALVKSRARPTFIRFKWRPSLPWAVFSAVVFAYAFLAISGTTDFIYFRF